MTPVAECILDGHVLAGAAAHRRPGRPGSRGRHQCAWRLGPGWVPDTGDIRRDLAARLHAAKRSGRLQPGSSVTAVVEVLIGAMLYRMLVRQPPTKHVADDLLEVVLDGAVAGP